MSRKRLDLSDIKDSELDETSTFTDLMTRKERKKRKKDINMYEDENVNSDVDIEEMISEKKRSTADLTKELNEAKKEYNKVINDEKNLEEDNDNKLEKTQILELTRQMKFNFEEKKKENNEHKKKYFSPLNVIGEVNLLCIGYYIYLLVFTDYQDSQNTYLITGNEVSIKHIEVKDED